MIQRQAVQPLPEGKKSKFDYQGGTNFHIPVSQEEKSNNKQEDGGGGSRAP